MNDDEDHGTFEATVTTLPTAQETHQRLLRSRITGMTELLDTTVVSNAQGTTTGIVRLYRVGGPGTGQPQHRLRIVVHRDFYDVQSFATAEVWSDIGTWTLLLGEPAERWHHDTPNGGRALRVGTIANQLLNRAVAVLLGS